MSSSRQPEPVDAAGIQVAGGRTRRPLSLRSKLILAIVAVITVVCVSIGIVTQLFISRYLTDQKDQQLLAAQERSMGFGDRRDNGQFPTGGGAGQQPPTSGTPTAPTTTPARPITTVTNACGSTDDGGRGRPEFLFLPGQSVGTLGARVVDGKVV